MKKQSQRALKILIMALCCPSLAIEKKKTLELHRAKHGPAATQMHFPIPLPHSRLLRCGLPEMPPAGGVYRAALSVFDTVS